MASERSACSISPHLAFCCMHCALHGAQAAQEAISTLLLVNIGSPQPGKQASMSPKLSGESLPPFQLVAGLKFRQVSTQRGIASSWPG